MKLFRSCYLVAGLLFLAGGCDRAEIPVASQPEPEPNDATALNYHALVIGIGDYGGSDWPRLGTAREDARAIGEVLRSRYGFNVIELTDRQATRGNILRTMDQFMRLGANDALLIYFAGHGFFDEKIDEGYWIPFGAKRSHMNLPAKEDWLWNSSISRLLGASPARHILLVADTCYGGSLFRGEDLQSRSINWYRRAMAVPSRYLVTSGNLEPVLDSGIRHSVFAQEVLNYLQYTDKSIFSASDIAVSIRSKVSSLTGQLVRMGPMALSAHAGGEFVFVRSETPLPPVDDVQAVSTGTTYRAAGTISLAEKIEAYSRKAAQSAFVRPRILACIGPVGKDQEEAMLVRNRLNRYLNAMGGCILVEREALDTLLKEGELGRSNLADHRATTEIGKLLPASLILFGEIIQAGAEKEIYLRIVDTETSRVLSSATTVFSSTDEVDQVCKPLADRIMKTMNQARPLLLPVSCIKDGMLEAGWGRFHGARENDVFEIVLRENLDTIAPRETSLGTARIHVLGEEKALLKPDWNDPNASPPLATLWLKAVL